MVDLTRAGITCASQHSIADPTAFERADDMRTLSHYSTAGPASPASSRYPPKEPTMRVADWVDW